MEHAKDCQLFTVPTYGLCTCDFDKRMAANMSHIRREARIARAKKYTPDMILALQDALIQDRQNGMVAGGLNYEAAKYRALVVFDAWETDMLNKLEAAE